MLPLQPASAEREGKKTLAGTDASPLTTEDHKLSKKVLVHTSRHIIINSDGDEKTVKSVSNGNESVTLTMNFHSTLNFSCTVNSVSNQFRDCDVTRVALLVKRGIFLI